MTRSEIIYCTIYKGKKEPGMYVYVDMKIGKDSIPDELKSRMGALSEVMTIAISPSKKLARADATRVLSEIREKGFYLQMPPEITGQVLFDGD